MYPKAFIQILYQSLPDEIKTCAIAESTLVSIGEIANDCNLSYEAESALAYQTTLLLIGLTSPDKFAASLQERLKIPLDIATKITKDIGEKILANVDEKILHAQEEYAQAKLKEWNQAAAQTTSSPVDPSPVTTLEIPPVNLPITQGNQPVTVKSATSQVSPPSSINLIPKEPIITAPQQPSYEKGKDPYRESVE